MAEYGDHFKKLKDAGLILFEDDCGPYKEVLEGLTPEQVHVLVHVKDQLDRVDASLGAELRPGRPPRFSTCIIF